VISQVLINNLYSMSFRNIDYQEDIMGFQSKYKISASSYYNLSRCQRRIYLDLYGDPKEKGEHSDFLEMLWEGGVQIEREIINNIKKEISISIVDGIAGESTFKQTVKLMKSGNPLIYQGVLIDGDKIGRPDLLEKVEGKSKFGKYCYIPCDIKSGRATTSKESGDIKSHYTNQILFYCDLLEIIQGTKPEYGNIIDPSELVTKFSIEQYLPKYEDNKTIINGIVYDKTEPELIISGFCKECVWSNSCLKLAQETEDPSMLYKLSKQKIELKKHKICKIDDLRSINVEEFLVPPKKIKGAGEKTLRQWKRRAEVWATKKPVIHTKYSFKKAKREIYYDVEDDPSLDHIYLHGYIEVINGKRGDYKSFLAVNMKDEVKAAKMLWDYIDSLDENDVIYHYGSYEKTKAKRLMEKYNLSTETMDKFDRLRADLYHIVEKCSDWPLTSYGIKSIAKYLGFQWTAEDASGANSIVWYNEYRENQEQKKDLLNKILTYNKEDCEAMIKVKEYLDQ
jgi:uncharacterized protein